MKSNIFWRATRRQPLRTVLLLLLTATVVFAFTARAAEYLLLKQEVENLSGYYKAIGRIARLSGATNPDMASFEDAKEFLENDPRVSHASWVQSCSGVLQGMYNADVFGVGSALECKSTHFYFTGTLIGISEARGFQQRRNYAPTPDGNWDLFCYFRQEQSLAGAPELVWEGRIVKILVPKEKARAVLDMLTVGEQYLVCGQGYRSYQIADDVLIENPTVKNSNLSEPITKWEYMKGGHRFTGLPLAVGGPMFYHIAENGEIDWNDPVLAGVEEEIQTCCEEKSALYVIATQDMETMTAIQPDQEIYLVDGRWLNYDDHAEQKKVCVIHNELLKLRGLSIGDTITVKLRDVDAGDLQWGYIRFPYTKDYEIATETFQIVGTYDRVRPHNHGYHVYRNDIYIPYSAVPEDFEASSQWCSIATLSFALTSPKVTEEFLADTREALAEMALQADMWDTGWDAFQTAVKPMLQSSRYNLIIFGLILLTGLCLVAFFYLRTRRRDVAIARALGVPAGACVRQGALPLAMIGFVGTLCGALLGWQYALCHGAETLTSLSAYGEGVAEIALPRYWLAAIFGGILLLIFILSLGGMAYLSRRPVLELLQGNVRAKQKEAKAVTQAAEDMRQYTAAEPRVAFTPLGGAAVPVQPAKRSLGVAHTLRFVGCYIRRSKVKSLLVLLLAVLFTVGLAAIRLSILQSSARIDELFNTVSIEMSLMRKNSSDYTMGGGFAAQKTIDSIQGAEFATDAYLEGGCAIMRIRREDVFIKDGDSKDLPSGLRDGDTGGSTLDGPPARMLSFTDLDSFCANGSEVEIEYQNGWDEGMFAEDWTNSDTLPVLMLTFLYESLNIPTGGRIALDILREDLGVTETRLLEVAGTYTGTPNAGKSDATPYLLTPASVMDNVMQGHTMYSTARFTLDSSWNRELDTVRTAVEEITEAAGAGLDSFAPRDMG